MLVCLLFTGAGEVALDKLADGVLVDGRVLLAEIGSLGEDLVDGADVGALAGVKKVLDEVSADETGTTKNEDVRHFFVIA